MDIGFIALGILLLIVVGVFMVLRAIWRAVFSAPQMPMRRGGADMSGEDEGNAHSGPYGYSGATAYPETQYGSGFDPDADWAEEYDR